MEIRTGRPSSSWFKSGARLDSRETRFMWPSWKGRGGQTGTRTKDLGFEFGVEIMRMKTSNYLAKNLVWRRTRDPRYPFLSEFEGKRCVIRLNEFPDEHLYTLIVDGQEVLSFDDWSAKWNRPVKVKSAGRSAHKSLAQSSKRRPSSKAA